MTKEDIGIILLNIKNSKIFKLSLNISLILIILYPSNLLFNSSFDFLIIETPFFKYLRVYSDMLSIPISFFLLFIFLVSFIKKKLLFNKEFIYLIILILYLISSILYFYFFVGYIDVRYFKNIIQSCILIFCLIYFVNINFNKKFFLYKCYNYILCTICLLNLINLSLFYNVGENGKFTYFIFLGYFSGYLNNLITHYLDYFPYVVYLSCAIDFLFFKKNKFIVLFFLFS